MVFKNSKMSLGKSLVISSVAHMAVLVPLYASPITMRNIERQKDVVVYYVRAEEPKIEIQKKIAAAKAEETPKVELKKNVVIKPAANPAVQEQQNPAAKKAVSSDLAKKQAQVKSTKDYINYFQLMREKIRQRLKINYRGLRKEGDVNIDFVLHSDGSLVNVAIESGSTYDMALRDITTKSIKEAAPFPVFPKALSLPSMSFNLVVSFKRE